MTLLLVCSYEKQFLGVLDKRCIDRTIFRRQFLYLLLFDFYAAPAAVHQYDLVELAKKLHACSVAQGTLMFIKTFVFAKSIFPISKPI